MSNCEIITGDALAELRKLPADSVDCCVTSPPYWGLRDYGVAGQIGLERTPEAYLARMVEVFEEVRRVLKPSGTCWVNMGDCYAGSGRGGNPTHESSTLQGSLGTQEQSMARRSRKATEIGGSARAAAVTGVARKALRAGFHAEQVDQGVIGRHWVPPAAGFKEKDLMGMPWRLAFRLQDAGWWLRQDIIWHKPNPMPESVTDRCTKAHEYIFLLSKSARYYYDQEATLEPCSEGTHARLAQNVAAQIGSERAHGGNGAKSNGNMKAVGRKMHRSTGVGFGHGYDQHPKPRVKNNPSFNEAMALQPTQRNLRSVWTMNTQGFAEAHFATFPEELARRCILAGCPADGLVLDPFAGSGTCGLVALKLGRRFLGLELNPKYVAMAERRIRNEAGLLLQA